MLIMERSEPALIPEWLKSNGSINGVNGINQHSSSSSFSQSGTRANTHHTKSKYSFSNGGYDSPRSVISDPSYFNRKSCSKSSVTNERNRLLRPYSSFNRSHHDRDLDTDLFDFCKKERWFLGDRRDRYGGSANSITYRNDKNELRRTQSLISEKQGESWSKQKPTDMNMGNNNDFPSFGAEERPGTPNIARISSPTLSSSQGFPTRVLSVIGDDGWTSALAEVPVVAENESMGQSSVQQPAPARSSTVASTTITGLNMAETLTQVPSRPRSAPEISVDAQRLEELAIKQSRQLIPLTSLVPKTSVLKSEKQKLNLASRSEMNPASKSGYQKLSSQQPVNHTLRGGNAKSDIARPTHVGKLLILKPTQERNGVPSGDKDSPTNNGGVSNNPPEVSPVSPVALRSSNNLKHNETNHKVTSRSVIYAPTMEKRPTASQVRSRNDFFNQMRNKNSANVSSAPVDSTSVLPTVLESFVDSVTEVATAVTSQANDPPSSNSSCRDFSSENGADMASNGDVLEESLLFPNSVEKSSEFVEVVRPDEEERAFLISLGWVENEGGDKGLTEEEIDAFISKYIQGKPSLKINCKFLQPKCPSPVTYQSGSFDSAEWSSSGSGSDA